MSEQTIKLIQLIKDGKSCNEICTILNISNKQLFNNLTNLRNKGIIYKRKYYSDGNIIYRPILSINGLNNEYKSVDNAIITQPSENKFKCIAISDLHFGNELERLDLLDRVYNYCIKSGIHIILCCGDMVDGAFTKGEQRIQSVYEQIEHFIKHYPFDKNILTFAVGGDHDHSCLYKEAQDLCEIVKSYRHDIILGSYNNSYVYIKNDSIHMYHYVSGGTLICKDSPISLHGHTHKYTTKIYERELLEVTVPSLSDINESFPTALELDFNFEKGYMKDVTIRQILFSDKDYILNEANHKLLKNINSKPCPIRYEEVFKTNQSFDPVELSGLTLENNNADTGCKTKRLSQTEKFNLKYGL